jgi:hypothetical protein
MTLALVCCFSLLAGAPDLAAHRLAAESFREADAAFGRGDFTAAGAAYEQAAHYEPHSSAWLNAAEAWERAGDAARSAQDCDEVLRLHDTSGPWLGEARRRLARLEPRIASLVFQGPRTIMIEIDQSPPATLPDQRRLKPGAHALRWVDLGSSRSSTLAVLLRAGEARTITYAAPSAVAEAVLTEVPPRLELGPDKETPRLVESIPLLSWIGFGVGTGAAIAGIALGGVTLGARDTFDAMPTQEHADAFFRDRLLTNVAFTVAVLAAAGGAVAWALSD